MLDGLTSSWQHDDLRDKLSAALVKIQNASCLDVVWQACDNSKSAASKDAEQVF